MQRSRDVGNVSNICRNTPTFANNPTNLIESRSIGAGLSPIAIAKTGHNHDFYFSDVWCLGASGKLLHFSIKNGGLIIKEMVNQNSAFDNVASLVHDVTITYALSFHRVFP